MRIVEDDLTGPEIAALLGEHGRRMAATSPPESNHTLEIDALRSPRITLWTAWEGPELLGCCGLKALDETSGEIKSMRTADAHLGKGVAMRFLRYIVRVSRDRGYERLYLETGTTPDFEPAHALYTKFGFVECGPFADYVVDDFSRYMVLEL